MKYHQNGVYPEYGEDHKLTNNWNPDLDYGSEYANVYFRIRSNGFNMYNFQHEEDKKKFYAEIRSFLEPLGWNFEHGKHDPNDDWGCGYIHRGNEDLYLHPQLFNGVILKNDVGVLGKLFEDAKTFECEWIDLYETYYDLSDETYQKYLDSKKNEIKQMIFDNASTKRRNLYHYSFEFIMDITKEVQLYRVKKINTCLANTEPQTMKFVEQLVDEMVKDGFLKRIEKSNQSYIRSINKTEQKEMKLKPVFI